MIRTCTSCGTKNRIPDKKVDEEAKCGRCKTPMAPLDVPVDIRSEAEFDSLITNSPLPVLIDFWADWCGPCKMVGPELAKLASEYAGRLVVAKVNTDTLQRLPLRFGVQGIPTMLLFKQGKEVRRISGAQPARTLSKQLGISL